MFSGLRRGVIDGLIQGFNRFGDIHIVIDDIALTGFIMEILTVTDDLIEFLFRGHVFNDDIGICCIPIFIRSPFYF